jgi:hypothetical protein
MGFNYVMINDYYSIYFFDDNTLFLSTPAGLFRSLDGGHNFILVNLNVSEEQMAFVTPNLGFGINSYFIDKTADGGVTWSNIYSEAEITNFMCFSDSQTGYLCSGTTILRTDDTGNSFIPVNSLVGMQSVVGVCLSGSNKIWAYADSMGSCCSDPYGVQLTETNSNGDIIHYEIDNSFMVHSMQFANPTVGYAIGHKTSETDSTTYHLYKNTTGTLGNNLFPNQQPIKLFPNPAKTSLQVQLPNSQNIDQLSVCNFMGQRIITQNGNTEPLNVSTLAPGLYLVEVISGKEKYSAQFVKE